MLVHSICMSFRWPDVRMAPLAKPPPPPFWLAAIAVTLTSIKMNTEKRRISLAIVLNMFLYFFYSNIVILIFKLDIFVMRIFEIFCS